MARAMGQRLPNVVRRKGVRQLQSLLAAGVEEAECCEQVAANFNVSQRTARNWLAIAFDGLSKEAEASRSELLGTALRRRRLVMARAAKDGDWKTYLAAADSEAKLLGLNAPVLTEHHVVLSKVQDMSRAVVEVVRDFFDDPAQRARFVDALRVRLNAQLAQRPDRLQIVIEAEAGEPPQLEAVNGSAPSEETPTPEEGGALVASRASDPRLTPVAPDVAPSAPVTEDAPSPA